jgi:hypothetical protein
MRTSGYEGAVRLYARQWKTCSILVTRAINRVTADPSDESEPPSFAEELEELQASLPTMGGLPKTFARGRERSSMKPRVAA